MPPFEPPLTESEITGLFPDIDFRGIIKTGGQGAVFRIAHSSYGDCAFKVTSPVFYERVEREINALRNIDHPNIYKLLDYGHVSIRGQSCPYTISRYIEGEDLQGKIVNSESIDEHEVRGILVSMCAALNVLWSCRIVHRDIKPSNILIQQDSSAILIDLGVARHLDMSSLTANGHWLGTPGYMSPEQANAQKALTVKSDIFALGITCYEALSGEHPFSCSQVLILRESPAMLIRDRVSCSHEISDLLTRMLEWRPVLRPMPSEIVRIITNGR